jgi:multidrug efflux system membrane fusion protein
LRFGVAFGCGSTNPAAAPPRPQSALVVTASAVAKDVPVEIKVIGNVEASTTVSVRSQVAGPLLKVNFRQGDTVKQGDTLFLIDPRPFDEAIRQAEANLARDTAYLRQAEANLQRDLAQEKFAREQSDRYLELSGGHPV